MIWPDNFGDRLAAWQQLRRDNRDQNLEQCVAAVNRWWMSSPWTSYYLHWDDLDQWPDPWQLLDDNVFCSLARGLGMLYTLNLLERHDLLDAELVETKNDNLVLINQGKYVLNWDKNAVVNINPDLGNPRHRLSMSSITQYIR